MQRTPALHVSRFHPNSSPPPPPRTAGCAAACPPTPSWGRSHCQSEAVGRGVPGVGFVEGDPHKTIGARVLLALARVLEELLLDLRVADSAVRPYADVVLRCLVTLFLAEEGLLAVRVRTGIRTVTQTP